MKKNKLPVDHFSGTLEQWLQDQSKHSLLRFITCGSVDDGKSTLIGRLLWESQKVADDQLSSLRLDSKFHGTQGEKLDFALLVDGLAAEREQGITIDVAYRYFSTSKRKFIAADTPGHEQYTRNMVTGASTADVAILLVDARKGLLTQTCRHAYLVSLMGIKEVVLAINKMDLISYNIDVYNSIQQAFNLLSKQFKFNQITTIPLSGLKGDNITNRSANMPWYQGPTLIGWLETVNPIRRSEDKFIFPVQYVNRPDANFRGLCGTIESGRVARGDLLRVSLSGQVSKVRQLLTTTGEMLEAQTGNAITIVLDDEVDASRGDILAKANHPLEITDHFEATIIWMNEFPGLIGRAYEIKLSTQWATASITSIKHRVDVNTQANIACHQLGLNDIAVCNIALSKPLVFDQYETSHALGGFILVDKFTQATVAAGMIHHNLRRAQNVHRQALSVAREDRERLNGHHGKVIWFTGLSGSGKSTIANALEKKLHSQGMRTYILDGDNIRQGLNKDLGFTDADRVENIRRIAEVAKLMMDAGLIVMTAFISPFRQEREMARILIGTENFVEIFINTPLEICEKRDPKGLYKKARNGEIPNMTGINSAYEPPKFPDYEVTPSEDGLTSTTDKLASYILEKLSEI